MKIQPYTSSLVTAFHLLPTEVSIVDGAASDILAKTVFPIPVIDVKLQLFSFSYWLLIGICDYKRQIDAPTINLIPFHFITHDTHNHLPDIPNSTYPTFIMKFLTSTVAALASAATLVAGAPAPEGGLQPRGHGCPFDGSQCKFYVCHTSICLNLIWTSLLTGCLVRQCMTLKDDLVLDLVRVVMLT